MAAAALPYTFRLQVPYESVQPAQYVANALSVDAEARRRFTLTAAAALTPDKVTKRVHVDGTTLCADFAASDLRTLRASLSAFMDMLALANRTLEAFA